MTRGSDLELDWGFGLCKEPQKYKLLSFVKVVGVAENWYLFWIAFYEVCFEAIIHAGKMVDHSFWRCGPKIKILFMSDFYKSLFQMINPRQSENTL